MNCGSGCDFMILDGEKMLNIIVMLDNFLHKRGIHTEIIVYLIYVIFVQIQQLPIYVRQFLLKVLLFKV